MQRLVFRNLFVGILLSSLLSMATEAQAATYYVDGEVGNDANPGTSRTAAWKTIGKLFDEIDTRTIGAGDTVLIRPGRYYALEGPTNYPYPEWIDGGVPPVGGVAGSPLVISVDTTYPGDVEITASLPAGFSTNGKIWSTAWAPAAETCIGPQNPWSCCAGAGTGCGGIYYSASALNWVNNDSAPGSCFQPGANPGDPPQMWELIYDDTKIPPIDMADFTPGKNQCWTFRESSSLCLAQDDPFRCCSGSGTGTCSGNAYVFAQTASGVSPAALSVQPEFPLQGEIVLFGRINPVGFITFTNNNNGRKFHFVWSLKRGLDFKNASNIVVEDFETAYLGAMTRGYASTTWSFGTRSTAGFPRSTGGDAYGMHVGYDSGPKTHHITLRRGELHHNGGDEMIHVSCNWTKGESPSTCTQDAECAQVSLGRSLGCISNECYYMDEDKTGHNTFEDLTFHDIPWEVPNGDTTTYGYSYSWPPPGYLAWSAIYDTHFNPLGGGGASPWVVIDQCHDEIYRRVNVYNAYTFRLETQPLGAWNGPVQPYRNLIEDSTFDFSRRQYAGSGNTYNGRGSPATATSRCASLSNCYGYGMLGAMHTGTGSFSADVPGEIWRNNVFRGCYGVCFESRVTGANHNEGSSQEGPQLVNNTFYLPGEEVAELANGPRIIMRDQFGTPSSPAIIKNNIFYRTTGSDSDVLIGVDSAATQYVALDNNLYGPSSNWQWGAKLASSLSQWQIASGQDTSSQQIEPFLVDAASGNFHLQSVSPAIDNGEDLSLLGFSADLEGNQRPYGAGWDIGAYEFQGTYTPPACGNNKREPGEHCDGTDVRGQTCSSLGFEGGNLKCASDCSDYDFSGCIYNTQGLIAAYSFDEGSGSVLVDESGNGNNGTISGALWASGRYGKALQFDGVDDYVLVPDSASLNPTREITVSGWVRPFSFANETIKALVEKNPSPQWSFSLDPNISPDSNYMSATINIGGATQHCGYGAVLEENTWQHVAFAYNGSSVMLYVNGQPFTSSQCSSVSGNIGTSTDDLRIGQFAAYGRQDTFNGMIDELRIYDRALTQQEIQTDMLLGVSGGSVATPPASPTGLQATAVTDATITLTWNANQEADLASYKLYRDNSLLATIPEPATTYTDTSLSPSTSYSYELTAVDLAGSESPRSPPVQVSTTAPPDTTAPTIRLTVPQDGQTVSDTITLTATASDNVAVTSVQFLLDASPLGGALITEPYTLSWDTTQASDGSHTLSATARDAAGNDTTSVGVAVTVDNTPSAGTVYYIGNFTGSSPSDDPSCGTRLNPCATIAYWNEYRRSILQSGDIVRLTGVFDSCTGPNCGTFHCIIAAEGVTYEGRTPDNAPADNYTSAIIDGTPFTPGDTPGCGRYIVNGEANLAGIDWQGFTLRDMTIRNAPFASGSYGAAVFNANPANCGGSCSNLTIDRVRFTGMVGRGGLQIGSVAPGDDNICPSSRSGSNIAVVDSEFDFNDNTGLVVVCMSNVLIARNTFHDNYPADCDPGNPGQCPGGPCDNTDGLIIGSSGTVEDNEAWNNAQTNFSFGSASTSTCDGVAHDIIFQRNVSHDPICGNHLSIVHCARDITLRNNFIWGKNRNGGGVCFNQKQCSWRLKFYNNTCWGAARALQWWENCYECGAVNNIFVNDSPTIDTVFVDEASTAPAVLWENNVVANLDLLGNQVVMRENPGGNCTAGSGCPECNGDPEAPNYPGSELMSGWGAASSQPTLTSGQLAVFQAGGDAGQWFGPESGDADRWSTAPAVLDGQSPSVANLHLDLVDTVAKDAGQDLSASGFSADYDGDSRTQGSAWDIGADEYVPIGVCAPGDVNCDGAAGDSSDIQLVVNVRLGLVTDQAVIQRADLNSDTKVDAADIQAIVNMSLGV